MDAATFIIQAGYGEEGSVREALAADPDLAWARSEAGISVIASTLYAGRPELAREIARGRDDLDFFEAACLGEHHRVAELLEADPKMIDRFAPDGFNAIGFAAFFGHTELLIQLLTRGAEFEAPSQNAMRVRPLHSAVAHSDQAKAIVLARILLEAGADPNAQQEGGMRPMHEAVCHANAELIELLLEFGANPHVSNDEGDSPLQLASSKGHHAIASRLSEVLPD